MPVVVILALLFPKILKNAQLQLIKNQTIYVNETY